LESGLAKSQKFFEEWYGRYSHKSIANTVWLQMVATNQSQLVARQLAYNQLAFFIEQSTRYVDFKKAGYYIDPDIAKSKYADLYIETNDNLIDLYQTLVDTGKNFFKREIPFEKWLEMKDGKGNKAAYNREIKGKVFDIARYALPQAVRTNIAWICDARSIEFEIAAGKGHPLRELMDFAEQTEKHAGMMAPSLLKYTEKNEYYEDKLHGYDEMFDYDTDVREIKKGVRILDIDHFTLNKLLTLMAMEQGRGDFRHFHNKIRELKESEKIEMLTRIVSERKGHDEWISLEESADVPKIIVEFATDIGAVRDLRRHQKNDRVEPLYSLDLGYSKPAIIEEYGEEVSSLYDIVMIGTHAADIRMSMDFPHQTQYIIPMACNHPIVMSLGIDQLQYIIATRSTPHGHFSYREDVTNLTEEVVKVFPWLLGLERYPKGKGIKEVYENAPLKDLIKLNTEETGLHS